MLRWCLYGSAMVRSVLEHVFTETRSNKNARMHEFILNSGNGYKLSRRPLQSDLGCSAERRQKGFAAEIRHDINTEESFWDKT